MSIGRRMPDGTEPHTYEPGDYGRWKGLWYCLPPGFEHGLGNLSGHTVTEHEDGTITVSPSILIGKDQAGSWHGFLERGVWRQV